MDPSKNPKKSHVYCIFDLFSNFQGNVKKNAPAVLPSDLSPNTLLTMIEEFNKTSHGLIMTLVCVYMYVCGCQ